MLTMRPQSLTATTRFGARRTTDLVNVRFKIWTIQVEPLHSIVSRTISFLVQISDSLHAAMRGLI